nr:MAG TPA: hypothetical protein [Caudoviricetes sp.]
MERLTRRGDTGHAYYPRCFEEPCNGNGCKFKDCPFDETICERLAAYEESGCAPEEVLPKDKADEIALKLMRLADLESLCSYDRLRELAEADKDGRVVVLPNKPSSTITNADRIRKATNQQLAKQIYDNQKELCWMVYKNLGFEDELNFSEDYSDILAWLNAPANTGVAKVDDDNG